MTIVEGAFRQIEEHGMAPIWISLADEKLAKARFSEAVTSSSPLRGMTFAVKDNIDVAGMHTTAACPEFAYTPERSASIVETLEAAGGVLIGKTNMDQFATGLVGTRSPYGACSCVFDDQYISGGSSSGSALAVAQGQAMFSLGTDTAGSGRVPAAFNNLIGLKPTRGLLSTRGVVPACRTLDCVSIFARSVNIARTVFLAARQFDEVDPYSRRNQTHAAPWVSSGLRVGVPPVSQREFFGDEEAAALYAKAIEKLGADTVEIDFDVFKETAALLYSGPWVAERLAAIESFIGKHADAMNPVVRGIITGGSRYSAVDTFRAQYKLRELCRRAEREWAKMDVLLLPTTGTIYTKDQVNADPVKLNTNLGYYTNFVNLMDLAAIAIPAGFRSNGLPFGVSLIGPAFSDEALLHLADRFLNNAAAPDAPGCVTVAVVGAHLTGQPLNWQLTGRGARLLRTCRTAMNYKLYALSQTVPEKPGLERVDGFQGPGIEVELWAMPEAEFGGFVASIPPPLGIGTVELNDKSAVKCFICEPYALREARDITSFGSWRSYRASLNK